jgi:glycosyltransferase involved in cell wall biosynthesis
MRILFIADPHITVPPVTYGGAERIVDLLCRAFAARGHEVDLMAAEGSNHYGGLLHTHKPPTRNYLSRARRKIQFQFQSLWAARHCDVVYCHGRVDYLRALFAIRKPTLIKFPNPIDQQQIDALEAIVQDRVVLHLLSADQQSHAVTRLPTHLVPNPIDCSRYPTGAGGGDYLLFLGRLSSSKGVDTAIEVARRAGRELVIAGNIGSAEDDDRYFQQAIKPHLDGDRVRWVGPVDDDQKQALLADAAALLFPIRWSEPFGTVMVESLACGTPVIALRAGSTPEVIQHGVTGFICDNDDQLVAAVGDLGRISRDRCRREAEERFDVEVIVPKLLALLEQLVAEGR